MRRESKPRFTVAVRLLPEPCLWCWEIRDTAHGDAVVESSWAADWTGFGSADEAWEAGQRRLRGLAA